MASRRRAVPLSRERVVAGGIALADAEGVAALTMRGLAASIGSEPMSLYRHVRSKADLLDGMVDGVAAEVVLPDGATSWHEAVAAIARGARAALQRHPWAAALWLRGPIGPRRAALMDELLGALAHSGRPADEVDRVFHAVVNHVVGFGVASAASDARDDDSSAGLDLDAYPHLAAHVEHHRRGVEGDGVDAFDFTLDAILDAMRSRGGD